MVAGGLVDAPLPRAEHLRSLPRRIERAEHRPGDPAALLDQPFGSFSALIAAWGAHNGDAPALHDDTTTLSWRETAERVRETVDRADRALLDAKSAGRNKVTISLTAA